MDVMNSLRLLLCALAAMLPAALGVSSVRLSGIKVNNSLMINQKLNRKILLNLNGPRLVKVVTELQSVFRDIACRNCTTCMERAIKADKIHSHVISNQPNVNELYYYLLSNNERAKRNTVETNVKIEHEKSSGTVTRYIKDKKVLALEVKETGDDGKSTCKVYAVKKSLPCDSGSDILAQKTSKRTKKMKERTPSHSQRVTVVTEKPITIPSAYKKRQVDNSQVLESFMPSIEDLY